MSNPKYVIGQPVTINKDRIVGSEPDSLTGEPTRLENVQGLYVGYDVKKGQQGHIMSVWEDWKEAENSKDALNVGVSISPDDVYYTVRIGLTDHYMIPEYMIDGVVDLKTKVEERLAKAQESKEFKDVGKRVGGTAKEKKAYSKILTSDLSEIEKDDVLARDLVKKDKVYPKLDIAKEQEKGVSTGAAYLKSKLREAYPSQPNDSKEKRQVYVGFAELLVSKFSDVLTIEEFNKARVDISQNALRYIIITLLPDKKEEIEEEANSLESSIINNNLELVELEKQKSELFEKYKEPSQWNPSYFNIDANKHLDYKEVVDTISKIKERIQYAKQGITQIEADAVNHIVKTKSTYYSRNYLAQDLIKELFGSRFYNFVYKYGDSVYKTYEDAKDFEAITEEDSKAILEKYNVPNKERLKEYEESIVLLKSKPSLQELQEYFAQKNRGSTGYHRTNFPVNFRKEYVYWEDLKSNAPMAELYANKHLNRLISDKENLEKSIEQYNKKFQPKESDWSWSGVRKKAEGEKSERAELTINKYPPLDHIKRTGGYKITDEDVTVENIVKHFSFKSVTLGNYVKDKEAREHIRHFLGAMADLGDILNLDIKFLNNIKGLSMWFGAGGYGKAGAYYRENGSVINLTKTNGDGAVAHEYAHYLDNCLRIIELPDTSGLSHKDLFASPVRQLRSNGSHYYTEKVKNYHVNEALTDIFKYIYDRKLPLYYTLTEDGKKVSADEYNKQVKIKEIIPAQSSKTYRLYLKGDDIDTALTNFFLSYPNFKMYENLSKRDRDILGFIVHKYGHKEYEIEFSTRTSMYFANSRKMSSDYWTKAWELFARAFETYIYDKLEKLGRTNNYLVSGAYFDRSEGVYPQGKEREILYDLYDKLFTTIKFEYKIPDYESWTSERVNEYIDLSVNKSEEETVAAVISDSETGKTLKIIDVKRQKKMKDKLKRLAEYLSENTKFEKGGVIFSQLVHHIKNKS